MHSPFFILFDSLGNFRIIHVRLRPNVPFSEIVPVIFHQPLDVHQRQIVHVVGGAIAEELRVEHIAPSEPVEGAGGVDLHFLATAEGLEDFICLALSNIREKTRNKAPAKRKDLCIDSDAIRKKIVFFFFFFKHVFYARKHDPEKNFFWHHYL